MRQLSLFGLGIMGRGIAHNLLKAGWPLTVYNRTQASARPVLEAGARWAPSPAEAAEKADVALSVVADDAASRAIWLGTAGMPGALAHLRPGSCLVECSTLSLGWLSELQQRARDQGVACVEAPLGGSKGAAQAGQLTLFVGATPEALAAVQPVLSAFATNVLHFGPPGAGMTYKLINNQLGSVHLAALGEAVAMARRAGLDAATVAQALATGATASPIVTAKLENVMADRHADVSFALRLMLKDARYAAELAEALGVPAPVAAAARAQYERAIEQGLGELDLSAIARLWPGR